MLLNKNYLIYKIKIDLSSLFNLLMIMLCYIRLISLLYNQMKIKLNFLNKNINQLILETNYYKTVYDIKKHIYKLYNVIPDRQILIISKNRQSSSKKTRIQK